LRDPFAATVDQGIPVAGKEFMEHLQCYTGMPTLHGSLANICRQN